MKKFIKTLWLPILASVIITAVIYILPINGEGALYGKVIRLHVIAASDSEEDQNLKLTVRDAILDSVTAYTEECNDKAQAEDVILSHIDDIKSQAEQALRENGSSLSVSVVLGEESYPTREYDGVRLPAGEYTSLRVMLGEAEGKNWWCVLFPPLCKDYASPKDELVSAGFTPDEIKIITDSDSPKYVLKFRILEFFESLFS